MTFTRAIEYLAAFYGFVSLYAVLYLGIQWLADRLEWRGWCRA